MTTWMIVSWVGVALMTGLNIFIFLKLKKAGEQLMSMSGALGGRGGPGNMKDAMAQAQQMMSGMNPQQMQQQMKMAMDMLARMNQKR